MEGKTIDIDEGHVDLGFQFNPAAHCYICKQRGHTKVDCPMRKCGYCFEMGHKKSDCPKLTEDIETERNESKVCFPYSSFETLVYYSLPTFICFLTFCFLSSMLYRRRSEKKSMRPRKREEPMR